MLLTIAIPTYNRSRFLREALEGFIPQIEAESLVEILVCDNASTDDTLENVNSLQATCKRLKYHRNSKNFGISGNILQCVESAIGDYIWFFADDDLILEGTVENVLATIRAHEPAILYLNHFAFDDGKPDIVVQKFLPERVLVFDAGLEFFKFAGLGFLSSLIIKKNYLDEFRSKVEAGRNNAHLEMAAYTALTKRGPFAFLGTVSIAARRPQTAGYNILVEGHANVLKIYRQLTAEGLLSETFFKEWRHRDLVYGVFRSALYQFSSGNASKVVSCEAELRKLYGMDWAYKFTIGLLCRLPPWLIIGPYRFLRATIRMIRIQNYKWRRKPGPRIVETNSVGSQSK